MRIVRPKLVLFLCTGNYYRSRFAEILFNHEIAKTRADCWAISRGLAVGDARNPGVISPWVVLALARRRITVFEHRLPMQAAACDLEAVEWAIAMNAEEHRPRIESQFPQSAAIVEYWDVRDVAPSPLYDPLAEIESSVQALIRGIAPPLPAALAG